MDLQEIPLSDLLAYTSPQGTGSPTAGPGTPATTNLPLGNGTPTNDIQALAKAKSDALFGPGEFPALQTLINNESGWRVDAKNPNSTASGLFQFLDSTGPRYGLNGSANTFSPSDQIDAGLKYIAARYGTPTKALNFWENIAPSSSVGGGSHWY